MRFRTQKRKTPKIHRKVGERSISFQEQKAPHTEELLHTKAFTHSKLFERHTHSFYPFAGAMQKRRKCFKYTFWTRDAQNTANTSVFESAAKKHCKLQHFWRVDRKKCWYSQGFCNFKKTWKARNTVNSGVLATFGRRNAGIYAVFCPWRRQTPVNYSIFFHF